MNRSLNNGEKHINKQFGDVNFTKSQKLGAGRAQVGGARRSIRTFRQRPESGICANFGKPMGRINECALREIWLQFRPKRMPRMNLQRKVYKIIKIVLDPFQNILWSASSRFCLYFIFFAQNAFAIQNLIKKLNFHQQLQYPMCTISIGAESV